MNRIATSLLSLVAAAGIVSATTVKTVTADLTGVGTALVDSQKSYVGPYALNVNGITYAALCVDFEDNATLGSSYSAYETQVSSVNLSNTYHPTFSTQYKEEAYLLNLILQPKADRIDIQHAAWAITDPDYRVTGTAETFVQDAQNSYQTLNFSNFDLISSIDPTCNRVQEFMIDPSASATAPEPSSMLLMGGGLVAAGLVRRKMVKKPQA